MTTPRTDSLLPRRRDPRGLSLVEVMVALALTLVVLGGVATMFRSAHAAFDDGASATAMHDSLRRAFRMMTDDIQRAGFNVNTLGDASVPDEQVEGAWESALFVRGDFGVDRESELEEESPRGYVSTRNDEIAGYVLLKDGAGGSTVSFNADLSSPRDAVLADDVVSDEEEATVIVSAAALSGQTDPPYSLHRVTFDDAGDAVMRHVASGVFQLRFRYYDEDGAELAASALGGADDQRAARASVRRIEAEVIGMSERPDLSYVDPATYSPDPVAARHHRKYQLSRTIVGFNLGEEGEYYAPVPPITLPPPTELIVCRGHCNALTATWQSTTPINVVRLDGGGTPEDVIVEGNAAFFGDLDPDVTYTVSVAAKWQDETSPFSEPVMIQPVHELPANTPEGASGPVEVLQPPTGGTTSPAPAVVIAWPPSERNVEALVNTCKDANGGTHSAPSPANVNLVDLEGYQVHRARASEGGGPDGSAGGFATSAATLVSGRPGNSPHPPPDQTVFRDLAAAPCQPYWYRTVPVDACGVTGDASPAMTDPAVADLAPDWRPLDASGLERQQPFTTSPAAGGAVHDVTLTWAPVTAMTDGVTTAPAVVAHYHVARQRRYRDETAAFAPDQAWEVYEDTRFVDSAPVRDALQARDYEYRYVVKAVFDCEWPRHGEFSQPVFVPCVPDAPATITQPYSGQLVSRGPFNAVTFVVSVGAGSAPWTRCVVRVVDALGNQAALLEDQTARASGAYSLTWNVAGVPGGQYVATATAYQGSCPLTTPGTPFQLEPEAPPACIVLVRNSGSPNVTSDVNELRVILRNVCAATVKIVGFTPTWQNAPKEPSTLQKIRISGVDRYDYGNDYTPGAGQPGHRSNFTNTPGWTLSLAAGQTSPVIAFHHANPLTGSGKRTYWPSLLVHTQSNDAGDEIGPIAP